MFGHGRTPRRPIAATPPRITTVRHAIADLIRPTYALVLVTVLALASCNSAADQADPGPATQDEAQALEDAASMLDEQRMTEEAPPDTSEETPE